MKSVCLPRSASPVSAELSRLSLLVRAPLRKPAASVEAADLLNPCRRAVHALGRQKFGRSPHSALKLGRTATTDGTLTVQSTNQRRVLTVVFAPGDSIHNVPESGPH